MLTFCGPGSLQALETNVARVRFAKMAADKGLFSNPRKPATLQGLLVGEKAYAQCVKESGKKDAKEEDAKNDEPKEGEGKPENQKPEAQTEPTPAPAETQQDKESGALVRRTNASLVIVDLLQDSSKQFKQELESQAADNPQ